MLFLRGNQTIFSISSRSPVFTLVMRLQLNCKFPTVTNATTTSFFLCLLKSYCWFATTDTIYVASRGQTACHNLGRWSAISSLSKQGPFIRRDLRAHSTSIRCFRLNNVPLSCWHKDALQGILLHARAGPCWCWLWCKVMHEWYFQELVKRRLKNVDKVWPAVTSNIVSRCCNCGLAKTDFWYAFFRDSFAISTLLHIALSWALKPSSCDFSL